MKEPNLLQLFRTQNTVFTFKEIALLLDSPDPPLLKRKVNYYVKKGYLRPLRRGIYAKDKDYNRFELGNKIYTPSYVTLETVLSREGVVFQYDSRIYLASYLTREINCDGQGYVFKKFKNPVLHSREGILKGENYFIATKERAFMDAIYLYGDYYFDNLASIDWEICRKLLPVYQNKSLAKKLDSYFELNQQNV